MSKFDFWLVHGNKHACESIDSAADLVPPAGKTHWRAKWIMGTQLLADDDQIMITSKGLKGRYADLVITQGSSDVVRHQAELHCEQPPFPGVKQGYHYMTGYLGNNDVVYVYRLKPANGKQRILLQRFVIGGSHESHEPTNASAISYSPPAEKAEFRAYTDRPDILIFTQDDEGSGEEP
ncbi:MAG: hypothetical protein R3F18_15275 [Lysobacterales bacterium]|nr:hypothetical protein [Xanthomonadales bacterium]MCB1613908.1 hypothetical protein [Xanthomonadales bacterium]MCP5474423.1 hypothetical protein [Rhodanobacteraceae bacterium]